MDWDYLYKTFWLVLTGIPVTLQITLVALVCATPLAFAMALCRIYNVKILKTISVIYISFIRAVPSVLLILIIYSFLPSFINAKFKQYGIAINVFDLDNIIYAYVVFFLISSALLAEIFRSALQSIKVGEIEAALASGLTLRQAYHRIVIPQALVVAIPNICNLAIGLIKASSLVFLMSIQDITAIAKISAAEGYRYIESYLDVFIVYLILCGIIQLICILLENIFARYKLKQVTIRKWNFI